MGLAEGEQFPVVALLQQRMSFLTVGTARQGCYTNGMEETGIVLLMVRRESTCARMRMP
jgi:hypothetical protein